MEEDDSVPLHLLQPQRDLVANWSVDVARELQAYLEQLARVFDDGSLCNFAKGTSEPFALSCVPSSCSPAACTAHHFSSLCLCARSRVGPSRLHPSV